MSLKSLIIGTGVSLVCLAGLYYIHKGMRNYRVEERIVVETPLALVVGLGIGKIIKRELYNERQM